MGNRLAFVAQVIFIVVAAALLCWLKYPGLRGFGTSTERLLGLFSGKDIEYERITRYPSGVGELHSKGPPLKYRFNVAAYGSAMAAVDRNDPASAERAFRDILAKTPDESSAAQGLGTALYLQRRFAESEDVFRKLLEQDPHFPNARAGLGGTLEAQGRHMSSIEQYSLALADDPTFALSYYGRGIAYSHVGKRVAAEADLQKALDLLPATAELAIMAREQLTVLAKQPAGTRN